MKRFLRIILLCALCLSPLTGCGQSAEKNMDNTTAQEAPKQGTAETEATVTGVDGFRDDTMYGDDGSLWAFTDDGEVTVTADDGEKTTYTYRLTDVTAYLTETTTGEEIEADAEYDDDGSITLFFDDNTAVILYPNPS